MLLTVEYVYYVRRIFGQPKSVKVSKTIMAPVYCQQVRVYNLRASSIVLPSQVLAQY